MIKNIIHLILGLFSGVIAAYCTIPLLSSFFGVTLTITGVSLVGGMYLYVLTSLLVCLGLAAVVGLFCWGIVLLVVNV